jgi:hypothetical protein
MPVKTQPQPICHQCLSRTLPLRRASGRWGCVCVSEQWNEWTGEMGRGQGLGGRRVCA